MLEKRVHAKEKVDYVRQRYTTRVMERSILTKFEEYRLMREPRGHKEMYGAILVRETEKTRTGEADIGVLFCHNGELAT